MNVALCSLLRWTKDGVLTDSELTPRRTGLLNGSLLEGRERESLGRVRVGAGQSV